MKLLSLLYTILFIELVRSTKKKITFDLLEPNIFQVTLDVRQDSGLEIKKYTPRKGFRINKVKCGDKELWKSRLIHSDGCKSIQFHSKGETKLITFWIVNNNNTLDIKRFNKVGDKWEKIELEGFNQKIREAKGRELGSNNGTKPTPVPDYKTKVDAKSLNVRESNIDGLFYLTCIPKPKTVITKLKYGDETIWDGGKKALFLSALIYFDGNKPRLATLSKKENGKDQTIFLHEDGGKWKENKAKHTRNLTILKETYGKTIPKRSVWREATSEVTPELSSLHTTSEEPKGATLQVPQVPIPHKQTTPVTLNLANPDQSNVVVYDRSGNGIKSKNYSPKDGYHISPVMDGTKEVWKVEDPNTKCRVVRVYANSDIEVLYLYIDCNGNPNCRYLEKVNGTWNGIKEAEFDKKVKEIRGELDIPVSPFLSKVDSTLFDLEESLESSVKVLKLTAKDDTHELTYGGEVLWEDKKNLFSSAVLYLDGGAPSLVLLETKDAKEKVAKVYIHHDGKKWKSQNEKDHNSKLQVLNERYKSTITPAPTPQVPQAPSTKATVGGSTSQASTPKPTTPFKLDITNPDRNKLTINDVAGNRLSYKEYVATGCYYINNVVDGKVDLWVAPQGQQCIAAKSFIQEADTIIAVFIKEGETRRRKCIEKRDGSWRDIDGETFEKKLNAIRREQSVRTIGNENTGNDDSPFGLRSPDDNEEAAPKQGTAKKSEHVVNVHASEIYTTTKKQEVATKPEAVKEDKEPQVQSKSTNCSLDLANIDEDEIVVNENKNYGGGVTQKEFSPKEGFKIDYILNNGTPVIKLSEGEEFRSIRSYSKRTSHLLMITMKKPEGVKHQYYERKAQDWYELNNRNEFNVRLNAMKGSG